MKVIKVKNYDEMSQIGFELMREVITNNKDAVLGLATGTTPLGVYERMRQDYLENKTSYETISAINLDEYVKMSDSNNQSYAYFMKENLFNHINIKSENCHIPNGMIDDLEVECERYTNLINEKNVDIQLLGIGSNGHIGFNEPNTPFEYQTHVVKLDERTRLDNARFFESINDVPTHAITMGIRSIMQAKKVVLLVSGREKAEAVNEMINGKISPHCPATVLQLHPNVIVVADELALSKVNA